MNPSEYGALARVEAEHWFYRGKRQIVRRWIGSAVAALEGQSLLDVGCGTGIFAAEMKDRFRVMAVDDHEESKKIAESRLGREHFRVASGTSLPFDSCSFDVLTALDVLEHIPNDRQALQEYFRVLKPGGVMILTVPAHPFLWSDWDEALQHCRRYGRKQLLAVVDEAGFSIIHWNFMNSFALPLAYLLRKIRSVFGNGRGLRIEERIPWAPLNVLMEGQFVELACQKVVRFPFGMSLLLVARKP